jgi:hypothetical protein
MADGMQARPDSQLTDRVHEPRETVMFPIRRLRRMAAALAGLVCAWLGITAAASAAFAVPVPPAGGEPTRITLPLGPPGWNKHPPLPVHAPVHEPVRVIVDTVFVGMPGWQIALIAVGAALFAATAAVFLDRVRAARRRPLVAAA